jgi:Tol biopolymer transport system component
MRSRRWLIVLAGAAVLMLLLGVVAGTYMSFIGRLRAQHPQPKQSQGSKGTPSPSSSAHNPGAQCPPVRLNEKDLGELAWTSGGQLTVMDLNDCKQTVVVTTGASAPVRFSPDGDWIGFGQAQVVAATGGAATTPLGTQVGFWRWSPSSDAIAGVTKSGGVVIGMPGKTPRTLLRSGSGVSHLAFSPDGKTLAIDRAGKGIQVLDIKTGKAKTALPVASSSAVPQVEGWSPDGNWIIYWRGPVRPNGSALDAIPVSGGPWVNLYEPVLPNADLISSCGSGIAMTVGSGVQLDSGKQIVLTNPPSWSYRHLSTDYSRSWFWPSCSPDGRWVATTDSLNFSGTAAATAPRALWLFAADGSSRTLAVPGTSGAVEYPRWSANGSVILAVLRSGQKGWSAKGRLLLVRMNPKDGRVTKVVGPFGDLGAAPGPGGDERWWAISDWYQPSAPP